MTGTSRTTRTAGPTRDAAVRTEARRGTIVLVGGYGQVGRQVPRPGPWFPGRLVLAGRTLPAARAAAASLGHVARPAQLDADALDRPRPPSVAGNPFRSSRKADQAVTAGTLVP